VPVWSQHRTVRRVAPGRKGGRRSSKGNWPDGASKIVRLPVSDGDVRGVGDIRRRAGFEPCEPFIVLDSLVWVSS